MFTGIIEEIGRVVSVRRGAKSSVLTIQAEKIFEDLKIGDSVSTNGVCLTATSIVNNCFTADVMNETLKRSTLGGFRAGSQVNLERAMVVEGRFGGHIVSGHVDAMGTISRIERDDNAIWYTIQADSNVMRYIVEKGSIAIDGISLTVASTERDYFRVSVIPHTAKETILSQKKIGDVVNLENDIVGKYIERFLGESSKIDEAFLRKNGF